MCELQFKGENLENSGKPWSEASPLAELECGGVKQKVKGFYAGKGIYKVRFLPNIAGRWNYKVSGCIEESGFVDVEEANGGKGIVHAKECHFCNEDGSTFHPFGTTVYALIHQEPELVKETMESLGGSPFNKVRFCVFPKHYDFNLNEPLYYAFAKKEDGKWDVTRPCFDFWDLLDNTILQLEKMGIQADLILFHPYDRWGFSEMPMEDNIIYLDYLLRRLSAMPNVWWSLSNEYDLCEAKTINDWEKIECYVADNDSYHHLISNHNCFAFWDHSRKNITHASLQTKMLTRISEWRRKYKKPIVVDECCYEGNIRHFWGSISAQEMTYRFWRVVTTGGYCTHGETFLDPERGVLWWSRGGKLKGESPKRIRFLRDIVEALPEPIEPIDTIVSDIYNASDEEIDKMCAENQQIHRHVVESIRRLGNDGIGFIGAEYEYNGHCGEDAYLRFYDRRTCSEDILELPEKYAYKVELIDTWEMTRTVLVEKARGKTDIKLPAKEGMAVLATRIE
jgi:hypothetical protein